MDDDISRKWRENIQSAQERFRENVINPLQACNEYSEKRRDYIKKRLPYLKAVIYEKLIDKIIRDEDSVND